MAKFEKGNSMGGRKHGSKNKVTQKAREYFTQLLNDNLDNLQADFDAIVEPEKRIKLFLDLAQYVMPKLRSVEAEVNNNVVANDFKITDIYQVDTMEEATKKFAEDFNKNY